MAEIHTVQGCSIRSDTGGYRVNLFGKFQEKELRHFHGLLSHVTSHVRPYRVLGMMASSWAGIPDVCLDCTLPMTRGEGAKSPFNDANHKNMNSVSPPVSAVGGARTPIRRGPYHVSRISQLCVTHITEMALLSCSLSRHKIFIWLTRR